MILLYSFRYRKLKNILMKNMKYKVALKHQNINSILLTDYFIIKGLILKITKQKDMMTYDCK